MPSTAAEVPDPPAKPRSRNRWGIVAAISGLIGIILTMNMAIGQFTPPMAVNLMVTTRIAGVTMESTVGWALWMVGAMLVALLLVTAFPQLALWLPQSLGY